MSSITVNIPATFPLNCIKGDTFVFGPYVKDVGGVDYDFTGCTATATVTLNGETIWTGSVALDPGRMVWRITDEATALLVACEARYRIRVFFANGDSTSFFAGPFKISNL